jgi:ABC-type multidrug transport system fused ATPase/permease subunit
LSEKTSPGTADIATPNLTSFCSVVGRLYALLDTAARRQFKWLLSLIFIGSLLEVLGVGMVLPFIALLQDPERFRDIEALSFLYAIYDRSGGHIFIITVAVGYFGVIVAKNLALAFIIHFRNRFLFDNRATLSKRLYRRYLNAPYELHLELNSAEMLRNTTGTVGQFTNGLYQVSIILIETLSFLMIFALLFVVSPYAVAVMAILLGAFGIGFVSYLRPRTTAWGQKSEAESMALIKWFNQGIDGVKEIRILGRSQFFDRHFAGHADMLAVHLRRHNTANELPRFFIEVLMVGGLCAALTVIVVSGEKLSDIIPMLGLFAVAGLRLMPSANRMITAYNGLKFSTPAIDILHDALHGTEDTDASPLTESRLKFEKEIVLTDVTFSYRNRAQASLVDIGLSIRKGERIGITGHTGAGKTTLVDLIMGMHKPQRGRVMVDGADVTGRPEAFRGLIGYVPQQVHLIDDTLTRNIAFGLDDDQIVPEQVHNAIRLASLNDLIDQLPDSVNTVVGEGGARLSGGQRQRIGIARALYDDPDILIFDEATSSLDYETEKQITRAIDALSGEKTIIVIAHRLSTVRSSDRILFMRDGRIESAGAFEDVRAASPEFRSLVEQMDDPRIGAVAPPDDRDGPTG